jgi:hypothetical protein
LREKWINLGCQNRSLIRRPRRHAHKHRHKAKNYDRPKLLRF